VPQHTYHGHNYHGHGGYEVSHHGKRAANAEAGAGAVDVKDAEADYGYYG